jgi:hypothetical protein
MGFFYKKVPGFFLAIIIIGLTIELVLIKSHNVLNSYTYNNNTLNKKITVPDTLNRREILFNTILHLPTTNDINKVVLPDLVLHHQIRFLDSNLLKQIIPLNPINDSIEVVPMGDLIGKDKESYLYYAGLDLKDSIFMMSLEFNNGQNNGFTRSLTIPIQINQIYLIGNIKFRIKDISKDNIKIVNIK